MQLIISTLALVAVVSATPLATANCFPYGTAKLPTDGSAPNVTLDQWWCPQSLAYGFQGFSYPLEDDDCSAASNGFAAMDKDFSQMKKDFGASVIRMYYPTCTQSSVFENAIKAAYKNNMALIPQVWTNFGGGTVWKTSQNAIYQALDKQSTIAAYVVHNADFGSEPVGDGMDGGGTQFVKDLGLFRQQMNRRHILAGISEDWDRPGTMSTGNALDSVGQGVKTNSDYAHIHPMPFYHFNQPESQAWAYIQSETLRVKKITGLPTVISETQWAWGKTDHNSGKSDVGVAQYTTFWKTFDSNCQWFKTNNVGWFLHAWRGEDTFDIIKPNGGYIIPNWRPQVC